MKKIFLELIITFCVIFFHRMVFFKFDPRLIPVAGLIVTNLLYENLPCLFMPNFSFPKIGLSKTGYPYLGNPSFSCNQPEDFY